MLYKYSGFRLTFAVYHTGVEARISIERDSCLFFLFSVNIDVTKLQSFHEAVSRFGFFLRSTDILHPSSDPSFKYIEPSCMTVLLISKNMLI